MHKRPRRGVPGIRRQPRVGLVDDAVHAALSRRVAQSPDQPLFPEAPPGSVPRGFQEEARVTVIRQ